MSQIAITGMGVVSPIGNGKKEFYNGLKNNRNGITTVELAGENCLAGVITDIFTQQEDRCFKFLDIACEEALRDSGLEVSAKSRRIGIVTGTVCGNSGIIYKNFEHYQNETMSDEDRKNLCEHKYNYFSAYISNKFHLNGLRVSLYNVCATGLCAISEAVNLLQNDRCDAVMVACADAFHEVVYYPLDCMRIIEKDKLRPFDISRKGTVVGEGCGCLILEKYDEAKKRNAKIYGSILGMGISNDAFNNVTPDQEAQGLVKAMGEAVRQAGIPRNDIDFINAHGTGTLANDIVEARAIESYFQEDIDNIVVNATKSYIGHTSAAAGVLGVIASLQSFENGWIHGILNHEKGISDKIKFCKDGMEKKDVKYFLSNAIGFGGVNTSVVIGR